MARAYVVVGPESSGTRLVTRILIKAGCVGDSGHWQAFDEELPIGILHIVWRRSILHGGIWPDMVALIAQLREAGYTVTVIVTFREWYANAMSQVACRYSASASETYERLPQIYRHIFGALIETNVPFETISYESLVLHPIDTQRELLKRLGLNTECRINITDGNAKHYKKAVK